MKKIRKLCCFCFSVLVFCSCAGNVDTNESKSSKNSLKNTGKVEVPDFTFSDESPVYTFESRYNYIKNKYPDKTILVWINSTDEKYEDEVNELLDKKHKDYAICFKNPDISQLNSNTNYTYWDLLSQTLKNEEQVDILYSGFTISGADGYSNSYQKCVNNGWFEPLDDYLEKTESGKKLKNLMPDKYWESLKINDKIYGFDGALTCLKEDAGFMYNTQILDKNSITDYYSFEAQLNSIKSICKDKNLKCSLTCLFYPESYTNYSFIGYNLYLDEDGTVKNYFETDEAERLFNSVSEGFFEGTIYNAFENHDFSISEVYAEANTSLCGRNISNRRQTEKYNGLSVKVDEEVEGYWFFPKYEEKINPALMAVGVYSKSKNKDKAFDAIAEIMSDQEINNLICFGPDYTLDKDGLVNTDQHYNAMGVENRLIRYPFYGVNSPDSIDKLKQALTEFDLSKLIGSKFDFSKVTEQINKVDQILIDINTEFPSDEYKTGTEYLSSLNKKLYDAGLQDIIDEANRQLGEFYEKNN